MLLCYNSLAMRRVFSLFMLLLSLFLISATCSRRREDTVKIGFPEVLIPDGLGVNIHFRGAPKRDMDLLKEAHIRFIRADLTWAQVERKKGIYDFSRFDALVESFTAQEGRILFILDYGNRLYGKGKTIKTETQRRAFADFAAAAAERYRGKGIIWEIWNEPNIKRFWGDEPNVDDYMALLEITCTAIRKADKYALIIAPATCGCDGGFIKRCAQRGLLEFVDGVSVHPYREGGPETVMQCYRNLRDIFIEYRQDSHELPRIISSEWGWGLSYMTEPIDGEVDAEVRQAAYLIRRFCVEAYAGIPCAIHYKWRENNHGLIRSNYKKKPAYTALKMLNEQLTGYCNSVTRLERASSDSVFIFLFKGEAGKKLAAWCIAGRESVSVPVTVRDVKAVDFLGNPVACKVRDGTLQLELSEKPLFVALYE